MFGFSRSARHRLPAARSCSIVVCPFVLYPVFLMNVLCFALLASAFNLLIGYVGLMSFGHAAYFGMGAYISAYAAKTWGLTPELCVLLGGVVGGLLGTWCSVGWRSGARASISP